MASLEQILKSTISIVKETGSFIRIESNSFNTNKVEHKGFNDLVSYVDKEAEKQLVERLAIILPEAGFIAEEGTSTKKGKYYNWIIDPLDGTTNFTHGLPIYSISVALMFQDEIVLGVVYEINRDECFYATKGSNAFCNEEEITVSKTLHLKDSLLATGFPYYSFEKMDGYLSILNQFMQTSHGLRRMGSAAVDLVYVACGRFEGFFEYNLNAWDVAAGAFIVQQAGGIVTDFKGENDFVFGREILASSKPTHPEMLKSIQKYW